jgi:2-C-methyl-D-erythritol 4-phosphate cytidylyltransferase/2-C-methyl-D-erythritol 2,4-cyclodiphosphate synthase
MFVSAIIAAGGRGLRLGSANPKQLLSIDGRSMLERSVSAFIAHPLVDEVIVALPADLVDAPPDCLTHPAKPLRIVVGGERRRDSVANAFQYVAARADVVVIHDAARPFASAGLIAKTIGAAAESGAALAALQARDTVKLAGPIEGGRPGLTEGGHAGPAEAGGAGPAKAGHYVRQTLARESIFLAQTPQAFQREILREALALTGEATDEAALVERAGHPVRLVEGEATNIKITTAEDLDIADAIARSADPERPASDRAASAVRRHAPARTGRAGIGYDLHRLVDGRLLILGGVTIPFARGLAGHSDADAVCHATTDAILGAACLGDIGLYFPDSDPRWAGAASLDLLERAVALVAEQGLEVGNVDITVVLESPKLRDHVGAMRANLARVLRVEPGRVSVKAKTNEGVDAVGRGEAIAVHAVALLRSRT